MKTLSGDGSIETDGHRASTVAWLYVYMAAQLMRRTVHSLPQETVTEGALLPVIYLKQIDTHKYKPTVMEVNEDGTQLTTRGSETSGITLQTSFSLKAQCVKFRSS